ncbi:MAG: CDP-2,3-bis-(O-geranylgeranyl)-sn-glycerol synthase [Candidatus Korarchaeota archaeon]|nr:CDP-2,3-bis-(O-geranylgeranyl)-sn-glycerol synthase [Thermoproteota archaeon]MCR8462680.1 CDP-2,3-bis-(O-geranylgeranyl)-sn-glycerol synthase [Thermoproteota archaeon]MCR8470299.1 CDP-2,3-bis-(O-geranylgeranyl)-sn-glycerol synthase [Thermoproteota archaeon]MCR8472636.1 CDP-2,3-bis-(O-geranylgeranyl)-sn-glycerol synthase [Thermoproteota archaeon]MCR8487956.1 CDP-2,3-bis-(O-geranylgeranyl)-sn-glycerol synthase [Thermoproteota archaeon]
MSDLLLSFLRALVYILPAYIANATPVITRGGPPLDFGKKFVDGKRIFGDNKTICGFFGGLTLGTLTGLVLPLIFPLVSLDEILVSDALLLAFLLSLGTHTGDLLGSFIKRRLNLKPGSTLPLMDQLGFAVFALLFSYPFYPLLSSFELMVCLLFTLLIHPLSNTIAYLAGLKNVPW